MPDQKFIIRLIGISILPFAIAHLTLNLFIIIGIRIIPVGDLQRIVNSLTHLFGPIAVRQDMNLLMLWVKFTVSALFIVSGLGIFMIREWARVSLIVLAVLRVLYGAAVCIALGSFHIHAAIMAVECAALVYYFTLSEVRREFPTY